MSSGVTTEDHLAYVGQQPWHGIGTPVLPDVSIEEMRVAAHLTWGVGVAPLVFELGGVLHPVPERVIYRDDTLKVLDVVGPDYVPVQNDEALEFFRDYLAAGKLTLNTAGSLWGGRYVWGLAKLSGGFTLAGGDQVGGYLLVANANRYGKGLVVKFVLERVVCHNTLTIALNESGRQVSIPHNRKFDEAARKDAQLKLGLAVDTFHTLQKEAETFSRLELVGLDVNTVLGKTFKLKKVEDAYVENRRATRVRELYEGAGIGATLASARGTGWGLLNAVTQYLDHESSRTADTRLRTMWFQSGGEATKNQARRALWALTRKAA